MTKFKDALRKVYKMRRNVSGRDSVVVAMPFEVIEREARKFGLSVDDFIAQYQVVAQYNSFDGVHYTFEKNKEANLDNGKTQGKACVGRSKP